MCFPDFCSLQHLTPGSTLHVRFISSPFYSYNANGPSKKGLKVNFSMSSLLLLKWLFPVNGAGLGSSPWDPRLGLEVQVMATPGCAWINALAILPSFPFRVNLTGSLDNSSIWPPVLLSKGRKWQELQSELLHGAGAMNTDHLFVLY